MGIKSYKVELCNGCGLCVEDCPMDVFILDEVAKKAIAAYPEDCCECSLYFCEKECPTQAIEISPRVTRKLWNPF